MIHRIEQPPLTKDFLAEKPVYLISADLPGCGSSTIAKMICQRITELTGEEPAFKPFGEDERAKVDAKSEEALAARRAEMTSDPKEVDRGYYSNLSAKKIHVVDGKLATTAGPKYIEGDRPIVSIDLTSNILTSAKRIAQREGIRFHEIVQDPVGTGFLDYVEKQRRRATIEASMREDVANDNSVEEPHGDNVTTINIDTSKMYSDEIAEYFRHDADLDFENYVPDWEVESLRITRATLAYVHSTLEGHIHPADLPHYQFQNQNLHYNLDRLVTTEDPDGLADIREQLRKSIIDCWFGLLMKETPRFFVDQEDKISLDTRSHRWTPEYYKIAEGWPVLSTKLKNKSILDPFGGAGTLAHLLVARGVVKSAQLSDISYKGGVPLDGGGHYNYESELNSQMTQVLFDDLASWYKPDFSPVKGRTQADARDLSHMKTNSVDYIVSDPPYGKNHGTGGIGILFGSLDEFDRVSKEGSILLVPTGWVDEIAASGRKVTRLTGDVSRGVSGFPVCYVHIPPKDRT